MGESSSFRGSPRDNCMDYFSLVNVRVGLVYAVVEFVVLGKD